MKDKLHRFSVEMRDKNLKFMQSLGIVNFRGNYTVSILVSYKETLDKLDPGNNIEFNSVSEKTSLDYTNLVYKAVY